eukprot:TRINITY_DN110_c1_g1_i1.p1 TRINITY_DN110_c1_g1~~TRINITY_DN110_c1_g1_i1.p1  ORF type:complete len:124 (-),score=13.60 TRINITY_DN110_c1_g1_i1:306-677(-)
MEPDQYITYLLERFEEIQQSIENKHESLKPIFDKIEEYQKTILLLRKLQVKKQDQDNLNDARDIFVVIRIIQDDIFDLKRLKGPVEVEINYLEKEITKIKTEYNNYYRGFYTNNYYPINNNNN